MWVKLFVALHKPLYSVYLSFLISKNFVRIEPTHKVVRRINRNKYMNSLKISLDNLLSKTKFIGTLWNTKTFHHVGTISEEVSWEVIRGIWESGLKWFRWRTDLDLEKFMTMVLWLVATARRESWSNSW